VNACNDIGIECPYNMPFVPLRNSLGDYVRSGHSEEDLVDYQGEALQRITKKIEGYKVLPEAIKNLCALPLFLIQKRKEDGTLCMIKIKAELCYKLILASAHSKQLTAEPHLLERQVDQFRETPCYCLADKLWLL